MYDIIGDIHGHVDLLEKLLHSLGYYKTPKGFKHRSRKAIFVGDYIEKGSHVMDVVRLIKDMVLSGHAIALPGNHEFNFLCYNKTDGHGNFLRPHTGKNKHQVEETVKAYSDNCDQMNEDLEWFQTLPIYFENDDFRVIHAAWIPSQIQFLNSDYKDNRLTDELLYSASSPGSKEFNAIENLLKGPEFQLPEGLSFYDHNKDLRNAIRIKWWEDVKGRMLMEAAVKSIDGIPDLCIDASDEWSGYSRDQKPVFFGHYCLNSSPQLISHNLCCVDYCIYRNFRIIAYRWNGEKKLIKSNLVVIE